MPRERIRADDPFPDNDNRPVPPNLQLDASSAAKVADRFRRATVWLILASGAVAIVLTFATNVHVDLEGTFIINLALAILLLISRIWWGRHGHERIADALGSMGLAALAGMSCGVIAMLELRLGFPIADEKLRAWDLALGVDGIALVDALIRQGRWLMAVMAPSYNYTLQIFFGTLIIQSLRGDRVEAWRGALCFAGTLFTTCLIAAAFPAKGLGMWAPDDLLARMPSRAMRNFWPHFDEFYFSAAPVLRLQVIDGVVSFPSFHSIVGFLTLAAWRKNIVTLLAAGTWLAFMLLSIFPGGGHYFVDLLGGLAVWAAWFALSRRIERQAARATK